MAERKGQVFVDERAIIVLLRLVLRSQRARSRSTRYLQISRWQFGAELSVIRKFIAVRVEMVCFPFFFFFFGMTQQNATLTGQERQRDVQLKVC